MDFTLFHGDCSKVLQAFPSNSIDAVISDPPYMVNFTDRNGRSIQGDTREGFILLLSAFRECYRVLKNNSYCVSFYGANRIAEFCQIWQQAGFKILEPITFRKRWASSTGIVQRTDEKAYILCKGRPPRPKHPLPSVIPWGKYTQNRHHPTQKSLKNMAQLVGAFSKPGDTILDCFMGSGTTGEAALRLGRVFIGMDVDPAHYTTAERRLIAVSAHLANRNAA